MSHDRDDVADLFSRLLSERVDPSDGLAETADGDRGGAVRLLGNALLNFTDLFGVESTAQLRDALPWLAAYQSLGAENGPQSADERVACVDRVFAELGVERLIGDELLGDCLQEGLADGIARAARLEQSLRGLEGLDDGELGRRLVSNADELALVAEWIGSAGEARLAERLRDRFPALAELGGGAAGKNANALRVLGALESGNAYRLVAGGESEGALSAKNRNFETSLARNMGRQGMIAAVRAAMAFGANDGDVSEGAVEESLYALPVCREHPELVELAGVLVAHRGRALRYVRGAAPLAHLSGWVDYLREGCHRLADAREISYREAVSYAHYCFHLLNVCDLAASEGGVDDETREALMVVENELKEFAMAGERGEPAADVGGLGSYDAMRWKTSGASAYLADRLMRLAGGWRAGTERGPIGAPPRLAEEVYRRAQRVWDEGADRSTLSGLSRVVRQLHLTGEEWLAEATFEETAKVLTTAAKYARDLPGVDVTQPFWVDLEPLGQALRQNDEGEAPSRAVRELFASHSIAGIFQGVWEPTGGEEGLTGRVVEGEKGSAVAIDLTLEAETRAMLTLLGDRETEPQPGEALGASLRERVARQLQSSEAAEQPSSQAKNVKTATTKV